MYLNLSNTSVPVAKANSSQFNVNRKQGDRKLFEYGSLLFLKFPVESSSLFAKLNSVDIGLVFSAGSQLVTNPNTAVSKEIILQ